MYIDCCKVSNNNQKYLTKKRYNKTKRRSIKSNSKSYKKCIRKKDNKLFSLPRKFTRKQCKNIKGFSMRSSCAPYKYCNH